jgi:uridine phosphorylase
MTQPLSHPFPWSDYVVHLPHPAHLADHYGEEEAEARAASLRQVRYLLLVGSLDRPRKVAVDAAARLGMPRVGTYFDVGNDRAVVDREFNIEVIDIGEGAHAAIISHGIGMSGAEIVIYEMLSLLNLDRQRRGLSGQHVLCGVGRSGTRATLRSDVALGSVGISTASLSDDFQVAMPDPLLLSMCHQTTQALNMPCALGSGISTAYFWSGQGRPLPQQRPQPPAMIDRAHAASQARLWSWVERGVSFVEMEDFTVNAACRWLGIPSVTVGAVIARRYDEVLGKFVLAYDREAKKQSELWPAEALLRTFQQHWAYVRAEGGPARALKLPSDRDWY